MNIGEALEDIACRGSGRGVSVFRADQEIERIEYPALYTEAGKVAGGLLDRGVADAERIAIALPTSVDFPIAFFGVIMAGAVPVPVPPPMRFGSGAAYAHRISMAMRTSRVRTMVSTAAMRDALSSSLLGTAGPVEILTVDDIAVTSVVRVDSAPEHTALVQYTSGTVNDPKGVVLSHANLMANVAAITKAMDGTDADVCCSWLPLFHDMGLIGTLLCAVLNDMELCMQPAEDFLRDPARWLRMISRRGGTLATAPNSAYAFTLRKVSSSALAELDLSSWRLALNGSETVDATTMRRFFEHFRSAGFRRNAFLPVYGLAEASLAVSFPPIGRQPRTIWARRDSLSHGTIALMPENTSRARELVSVGTPVSGIEVRLVTEDGEVIGDEDTVGEIQIRGDSVTRGYERDDQDVKSSPRRDDGWVFTGDLGCMHGSELFISGRKKEKIIILGQNYYASDIESIAGNVPGVADQGVLATGVDNVDDEELVLFVETTAVRHDARAELVSRVRNAVSSALGVAPREIILLRRGKLPRTSSGKLVRKGVDALYAEHASGRVSSTRHAQ